MTDQAATEALSQVNDMLVSVSLQLRDFYNKAHGLSVCANNARQDLLTDLADADPAERDAALKDIGNAAAELTRVAAELNKAARTVLAGRKVTEEHLRTHRRNEKDVMILNAATWGWLDDIHAEADRLWARVEAQGR